MLSGLTPFRRATLNWLSLPLDVFYSTPHVCVLSWSFWLALDPSACPDGLAAAPSPDQEGGWVVRIPPSTGEEWPRALEPKGYPDQKAPEYRKTLKLRLAAGVRATIRYVESLDPNGEERTRITLRCAGEPQATGFSYD